MQDSALTGLPQIGCYLAKKIYSRHVVSLIPRSSSPSHEGLQSLDSCPQTPPSSSSFELVTMLPTAIQTRLSIPSLRRTLSDFSMRTRAKEDSNTDMILHRRSESTDLVLSQGVSSDLSIELKSKLSLHGTSHKPLPRSCLHFRKTQLITGTHRLQPPPSLSCRVANLQPRLPRLLPATLP